MRSIPNFTGGVRVAAGDMLGNGLADIVAAAGPGGGPQVAIFNGQTLGLISTFETLASNFSGGLYVAVGDVNGDGRNDVITTAGPGGGPQVTVFDGKTFNLISSFYAQINGLIQQASPQNGLSNDGVRVAAVYLGGSTGGAASIATVGGPGANSLVDIQNGLTAQILDSFFAFDPSFKGGSFIGA